MQISPYADQIVTLLPQLWEQSGDEHLMKQAILTLMSALIHSMKQDSVRYHPLVLPLIQSSIEPGSVCFHGSYVFLDCGITYQTILGIINLSIGGIP